MSSDLCEQARQEFAEGVVSDVLTAAALNAQRDTETMGAGVDTGSAQKKEQPITLDVLEDLGRLGDELSEQIHRAETAISAQLEQAQQAAEAFTDQIKAQTLELQAAARQLLATRGARRARARARFIAALSALAAQRRHLSAGLEAVGSTLDELISRGEQLLSIAVDRGARPARCRRSHLSAHLGTGSLIGAHRAAHGPPLGRQQIHMHRAAQCSCLILSTNPRGAL